MRDLLDILTAAAALPAGEPFTLATVVRVEGSSYRLPGARMLVDAAGRRVGSVSGGCLESEVARRGRLLWASHPAEVVRFDSADDDAAWGFGLGCNGCIEVLIERCSGTNDGGLSFIRNCVKERIGGAMATIFTAANTSEPGGSAAGSSDTLTTDQSPKNRRPSRSAPSWISLSPRRIFQTNDALTDRTCLTAEIPTLIAGLHSVVRSGRPATLRYDSAAGPVEAFIEPIRPPLPVVIFGAGHDAVPLVDAAKHLGWHVTVWDRRAGHARADRFPAADAVVCSDAADALTAAAVTPDTVAVVMNHHYPTDAELVGLLLGLPARYVGVLGPRARTQRIIAGSTATSSLYAPVGLDLGADGPEQVAVAVVAEILAMLSGRNGGPLRLRNGPIHATPAPQVTA